jgi:hypothetical protein
MIYDHDDRPLLSTTLSIGPSTDLQFKIEIDCRAGEFLRATAVADITVSARHHGTGGAFTNIETTPLALGTWDGDKEEFDIKIESSAFTEYARRSFFLSVGI